MKACVDEGERKHPVAAKEVRGPRPEGAGYHRQPREGVLGENYATGNLANDRDYQQGIQQKLEYAPSCLPATCQRHNPLSSKDYMGDDQREHRYTEPLVRDLVYKSRCLNEHENKRQAYIHCDLRTSR